MCKSTPARRAPLLQLRELFLEARRRRRHRDDDRAADCANDGSAHVFGQLVDANLLSLAEALLHFAFPLAFAFVVFFFVAFGAAAGSGSLRFSCCRCSLRTFLGSMPKRFASATRSLVPE